MAFQQYRGYNIVGGRLECGRAWPGTLKILSWLWPGCLIFVVVCGKVLKFIAAW